MNEVAFGFSRNLRSFKKLFSHARDYNDLHLSPFQPGFAQELKYAMREAATIRFDVSGMRCLTGKHGVLTGPAELNCEGSTNWELRTIFDDADLRAKTTVYVDGVITTFEDLLEGET
ncbi:hypothetical protein [Stratiformator vulcanicus]|uniref:Uncharacterized protein n=1 Tax=Stratiformator vulcanicus TaxID=2527980 RepID=A0A517R680_9PLAN|nr:hypothetical protein [Stratiformator vulcanicus]QDT39407.1 hypothetical protein Pan189_38140 [Stratiformator vulcanicus]